MNMSSSLITSQLLKFRLKHKLVKHVKLLIASNSMAPCLRRGDTVCVVDSDCYEVGDIIAYTHSEKSITVHRIIRIDAHQIYTKGDNNSMEDGYYLTKDKIIGKVEGIIDD